MKQAERRLFEALRDEVEKTFNRNTGLDVPVSKWSVQDIDRFRDDLEVKVRSKVSEKWVYLHFKNTSDTLPRIDVLNLLSLYAGYTSWHNFKASHRSSLRRKYRVPAVLILLLVSTFIITARLSKPSARENRIYMEIRDSYTNEPVDGVKLYFVTGNGTTDSIRRGLYSVMYRDSVLLRLEERGYYKPMQIALANERKDTLLVSLEPDDVAFMLNYFSNSEPERWLKKAVQLDTLLHDAAKIYRYHTAYNGIELLNKSEFISRLIVPTRALKEMKILDLQYKDGKVYRLRFQTEE